MLRKGRSIFTLLLAMLVAAIGAEARPLFDRTKDLLLLHHDMGNDPDDLCAVVVEACMLKDPSYSDVDYFIVAGTRNLYSGHFGWIGECRPLLTQMYGPKGDMWIDAEDAAQWDVALDVVTAKVKTILLNGGRAWVVEAGTSDFTRDWLERLKNDATVDNALLLTHVVVVQHSVTNESNTDPDDLLFVQNNSDYTKVGVGKTENDTPRYLGDSTAYRINARAAGNPNLFARESFTALETALAPYTNNRTLANGGVDFTDSVEMWWALSMGTPAAYVDSVWSNYIVNDPNGSEEPVDDETGKVFQEAGGLVIMEMESTESPLGNWLKLEPGDANYTADATGTGHLEFNGNSQSGGSPNSPLTYTFKINQSGTYSLNLRARKRLDGAANDLCNDCYIRMDGNYTSGSTVYDATTLAQDQKCYGGNENDWGWALKIDLHDGVRPTVKYKFVAGETYTLTISGRSKRFNIDRIILSHSTIALADARNTSNPESDTIQPVAPEAKYSFLALDDFPTITGGAVAYYADTKNSALAIDASVVADRDQFARAAVKFNGTNGTYSAQITTLTEEDGESTYRLLVNGSVVATYQNPYIGPGSAQDRKAHTHTWTNIVLGNGDELAVESNTATNGEIPEGTGTAWSRGRWSQLDLLKEMLLNTITLPKEETYGNEGNPWAIRATAATRLEAGSENQGGGEVSYHDTTADNTGGEYRTDDVDIQVTGDTGGGYHVSHTVDGEWLNYTVDVQQAGAYQLTLRVARKQTADGALQIATNGVDLGGTISVTGTGNWAIFTNVTHTVQLSAGVQTLRFTLGGAYNINYFEFTPAVNADGDGDGMPDSWENEHFKDLGHSGGADDDGDGISNFQEYIAGTHPTNRLSVLKVKEPKSAVSGYSLKWDSVPGREYMVYKASSLSATAWAAALELPIPGTGGELGFVDGSPGSNRFYRVQVSLP